VSVAGDIADLVKTGITALALSSVTVKRRKTLSLPQGEDPPQVVVAVGDEPDTEYLTADENLNRYAVGVAILTAGGKKTGDDDTIRDWRQSIRRKIDDLERTTFATLTGFNRVTTGGRNPFNTAGLPKDLNVSIQVFTVEVLEARQA
jgi:hypothetical protein